MNDEEQLAFSASKRFRTRPMRGAKQIQSDVRHGPRGGYVGGNGTLPLYPPFHNPPSPSYR